MNKQTENSLRELKDFIEKHNLRDNYSNVLFQATVDIEAFERQIYREEIEILVNEQVYGKASELVFTKHNLNYEFYPLQFFPDFQTFTHVNTAYLKIEGTHTHRPKIGKYVVRIFPLNNL